jgi:glycosyltransferase involved in cell wall biosynthesis
MELKANPQNGSGQRFDLTVVSPFFNEELSLRQFCFVLRQNLEMTKLRYEVILVDDGSTDSSVQILKSIDWPECKVVCLNRNSGHQVALEAGYQSASGDWIVTLDSDLQHPPEIIHSLYEEAVNKQLDVVYAIRANREGDGILKKSTALIFYRIIRALTMVDILKSSADFRIISRKVLNTVNALSEEKVFRLLIPSLGFPSGFVEYEVAERFAGQTKYSLRKMVSLALNSAIGFSTLPLRVATVIGIGFAVFGFGYALYALFCVIAGVAVSGWASLIIPILVLGGFQLIALGLLGEYVGRIYQTLKQRPHYVVRYFGPINEL